MPGWPCLWWDFEFIICNSVSIVDQLMVNTNIKPFPPFMESTMSTKTSHCTLASDTWIHHLATKSRMTRLLGDTTERVTYLEIKCQLDATEIFIVDLIACSTCFGHHYAHHLELKSIIQWLLPVVFRAVVFKLLVWCGAEGYVSDLQVAVATTV